MNDITELAKDVLAKAEKAKPSWTSAYIVAAANAAPELAEYVMRTEKDWRQAAAELIDILEKHPDAVPDTIKLIKKTLIERESYRICSYCGHMEIDANRMTDHVSQCQSNPQVAVLAAKDAEIAELRQALDSIPEWVIHGTWDTPRCLSCGGKQYYGGHTDKCERQKVSIK